MGTLTLVIRAAGLAERDRVRVGTLTLDPSRPGGSSQESKNRHAVERPPRRKVALDPQPRTRTRTNTIPNGTEANAAG